MAPKLLRKECPYCGRSFNTYEVDKHYCSQECLAKETYNRHFHIVKEKIKKTCRHCGLAISSISNKSYCDVICRHKANNLKYLKGKPKKKTPSTRKKKSYDQLNREEEYRRLYDPFHIERIIRGKS